MDEISRSLQTYLSPYGFKVIYNHSKAGRGVIHFSSIYSLPEIANNFSRKLKYGFTFFHVAEAHNQYLEQLSDCQSEISFIHTSNLIAKERFLDHNISEDKIKIIPIGIELSDFSAATKLDKNEMKRKLGIPKGSIVIGSFQKDGSGWGEGMEAKLIKGPDVFCNAVEKLSTDLPIFVLLTGPSRGYVKDRLGKAGIPYKHIFLENPKEIFQYYRALDLYIVSSRVEGGPRAPLECMACGVPFISTKVGQTPSVVTHGEDGYLVEVGK